MMDFGAVIGALTVIGLIVVGFSAAIKARREDEHQQILERRLRDIRSEYPDFDGEVVRFERRT